jgi:putative ABC transport system permease protein
MFEIPSANPYKGKDYNLTKKSTYTYRPYFFNMWRNYLRIAFRNLQRYRTNTLINILSIALGISGGLVIYTVLKHETNFDAFHTKSSQTYRIVQHNHTAEGTQFWNTTAYPLAEALRQDFNLEITQKAGPMPVESLRSE